jgi:putative tryptophan/tyrosine transport system substrate-binding protein
MRRREFIAGLGSAAAAWPSAAQAQLSPMPMIGFLNSGSYDNPVWVELLAGFRQGLKDAGYVEGQNASIEFRWADGQYNLLPAMAADLVRRKAAVIFAGGDPAASAAEAATSTIPIVFTGDDVVKLSLVASLNRPGGNATGINFLHNAMGAKRLGLLHQLVPKAAKIAVLLNPKYSGTETESKDVQMAARSIGQEIILLNASSEHEIDTAFTTMVQQGAAALLVGNDIFFNVRREQVVALAAHYALPAIYHDRGFPVVGGLISYGISISEGYRQAGNYVGRILKGEMPADLPIMQPTNFELVINLKIAKTLGLEIPSGVLAIADEVFE